MLSILLNPDAGKMEYSADFHASSDEVPRCTGAIPVPKHSDPRKLAHRFSACLLRPPDFRFPIAKTPLKPGDGAAVAQLASNNPPQIGSIDRTMLEDHGVDGGDNARAAIDHSLEQVYVLAAGQVEAGRERSRAIRQRIAPEKGVARTCGVPRHNGPVSAEQVVEGAAGPDIIRHLVREYPLDRTDHHVCARCIRHLGELRE